MSDNTKRFTIANLIPGKPYVLQARSKDDGETTGWGTKTSFITITDATSGGASGGEWTAPVATTLLAWEVVPTGFYGAWNAVTFMYNGKETVVTHYEMELTDSISGQTKIWKYFNNAKPVVSITMPLNFMVSLFGGPVGTVTLRVRAINSAGTAGDWSNPLSATMGVPDPPTNAVVVEAVDSIKVSWTPPANKNFVSGYRVYVGLTAGFTPSVSNRVYEGAAANYNHVSATYSLHYFKIRSYFDGGTESTDLVATGTPKSPFTIDVAPPTVPVLSGNLSAGGVTPRFADLTWTFNAGTPGNEDVAGFVVAWHKVGDTNWKQSFFSPELRAGSIELPLPYADYEFKISSYDKVGNYSAYGTLLSLGGAIPGAPAQVTGVASTASLDAFRLTWTANTEGDVINGGVYNVDIATNSGFTTGLQQYTTGATNITVNGLLPATTYYYRVRAVDVGGTAGIYSATGNRQTPDYAPAKSDGAAPTTSPTVTLVQGVGYLTALWNRVANADLVTYEVHISTTTGFTPVNPTTMVTETTGTSTIIRTTAAKAALAYGTTYYVKVVAKDADGPAAASAQASATVLQAINADIADVSFGKITSGSISSQTFTIAPGGSLTTANGDTTITGTGITVGGNSNISAAAMQAGTAFVDDLTIQSNFTINTGGVMKSSNYSPGAAGWQLSNTSLDIRSGTVAAGTLVAGVITSPSISVGANGVITIDSTGVIKSNNYSVGSTGWQISATGIEMNDSNSSIKVNALKSGNISSTTIVLGTASTSGVIQSYNWNGTSTGWRISDTSFVLYGGTIQGSAVYTNQLASLTTDGNSPLPPIPGQSQGASFGINAAGKAVFSGALIYGNTVLGGGTTNFVQSNIWSPGSAGWIIRGDGYAEFANMFVYGDSRVGGSLTSATYNPGAYTGWTLNQNGSATFYGGDFIIGNFGGGFVRTLTATDQDGWSSGQIRFYPPGGIGSYYHSIRPGRSNLNTEALRIRGAAGGAVALTDSSSVTNVGNIGNCVTISVNANVTNNLYVDNYSRFNGGIDVVGGSTFWNTLRIKNQTVVEGNITCNSFDVSGGIQLGGNGNLNVNYNWIYGHSLNLPYAFSGDPDFQWVGDIASGQRQAGFGADGHLRVFTSSRRYKENIVPIGYTKEQILSLEPKFYNHKDPDQQHVIGNVGFIAEDAHDAGLTRFVEYDYAGEDGDMDDLRPDGFMYNLFVAALQKVNIEQQKEIDTLRSDYDSLLSRLEALEA